MRFVLKRSAVVADSRPTSGAVDKFAARLEEYIMNKMGEVEIVSGYGDNPAEFELTITPADSNTDAIVEKGLLRSLSQSNVRNFTKGKSFLDKKTYSVQITLSAT